MILPFEQQVTSCELSQRLKAVGFEIPDDATEAEARGLMLEWVEERKVKL